MELKRYQRFFLSICSGLILSLGWTQLSLGLVMFIGFIPLLIVENHIYINKSSFKSINAFGYSYITFFTWNIVSTWWIYNSTFMGAALAIVLNSLFMAIVFFGFHVAKRIIGAKWGYLSLIVFWVAFEYLHLNWDLSWTWLTLGNSFANNISLVQWYEFTGALGGSLWIMVMNILLYKAFMGYLEEKKLSKRLLIPLIIAIIPIIISISIYFTYKETSRPCNIVVLQPNIDPYNEKFGGMSPEAQLEKTLKLAEAKVDAKTNYIVGPETALTDNACENFLSQQNGIKTLKSFVAKYPNVNLVIGLSSFRYFNSNEQIPLSARKYNSDNTYYDYYNTALQVDTSNNIQIYHKSQLVLGVEKMPYPKVFGFLEKLSIDLGGTSGSLGSQKERGNFKSCNLPYSISPVICYESIYGEYVTDYIKKGSNFIFIITNDGWWGNTPGYKQHLSFARLRAIETRRSIARSANTGISCFINQKGEYIAKTNWWTADALKATINANEKITFYVKHGDYIGTLVSYLTLLMLIYTLFIFIKRLF